VTRKQYRAAWHRRDYARRRATGQCVRCPLRARAGMSRCADCERLHQESKRDQLAKRSA